MTEGELKEHRGQAIRDNIGLISELDFSLAIGVTIPTLQTWRSSGVGPAFTKMGKTVFYRLQDIKEWADCNVQKTTPVQQSFNEGTD